MVNSPVTKQQNSVDKEPDTVKDQLNQPDNPDNDDINSLLARMDSAFKGKSHLLPESSLEQQKSLAQSTPLDQKGLAITVKVQNLNLFYESNQALTDINLVIPKNCVNAFIGPSGCGKSTLLRCFNRMNDLISGCHVDGTITIDEENIYDKSVDVAGLRRKVGMVFQKPNPFPKSIYENVAYGLRLQGINNRKLLDEIVEQSLQRAALWDDVKDRLKDNALGLSGGQQQRLVIARAIAVEPEILLLDEPTSSLDPASTFKIEELIGNLKNEYTIIIVTHNMQQAARISDYTAYFYLGQLIEQSDTATIFTRPKHKATEYYITGCYG